MSDNEYRLGYAGCREHLVRRLAEPAPGRIQLLTGPRQVGKTTLLLELARDLGDAALYAAGDAPETAVPGSWEALWRRAQEAARAQGRAALLLDEIQYVPDWPTRLKTEWDRVRRHQIPLHVVATGSSALRLGTGSRERLAGRFERLTLTHWTARDLAGAFGLERDEAVGAVVAQGAYPGGVPFRADPARWKAYVGDAIVEPAVGRDLLAQGGVRKPGLLRQVFAACAALPAQVVSLQKLRGALDDAGALETVSHYLRLLEEAYLVAGLEKYSRRPSRRRAAPPKIAVLSNAIVAVTDPRGAPHPAREPDRYGTWVENACLAYAWNAGQQVTYWREEPLDVDGVFEGSWGSWAVEVKTGAFPVRDLTGLLQFVRRYPAFRPLVLCDDRRTEPARAAGVLAIPWTEFLWSGPPR
ncbi:MAG: ATP-binding protein [Gemmatimonadetes bacterium]|nr:ATP-binding protein [Gemmatimonadota bacterium]